MYPQHLYVCNYTSSKCKLYSFTIYVQVCILKLFNDTCITNWLNSVITILYMYLSVMPFLSPVIHIPVHTSQNPIEPGIYSNQCAVPQIIALLWLFLFIKSFRSKLLFTPKIKALIGLSELQSWIQVHVHILMCICVGVV